MLHKHCYKLIRCFSRIVGHRFEKATNSFLIIIRNTSELIDQFLFGSGKQLTKRCGTPPSQHKSCVYASFLKGRHIAEVERVCSQFIIFCVPRLTPKSTPNSV